MASKSATMAQVPLMTNRCIDHEEELVFDCKDCKRRVCMDCITSTRKGHNFQKIIDIDRCGDHHQKLVFVCEGCDEQMICMDCVISTHSGHSFKKISDVAATKTETVTNYVKHAEKSYLPDIEKQIKSADEKRQQRSKHMKTIIDEIRKREEEAKLEIDKIINECIDVCRDIEECNIDLLSKYRDELQSIYDQLSDRVDR